MPGSSIPTETLLKIKADYQAGLGSCRELAEKYKVSVNAVQNRCKRQGWRKETEALMTKANDQVTKELAKRAIDVVEMRERVLTNAFEDGEMIRSLFLKSLEYIEAGDLNSLRKVAEVYKISSDQQRKALALAPEAPKEQYSYNNMNCMIQIGLSPCDPPPDEAINVNGS